LDGGVGRGAAAGRRERRRLEEPPELELEGFGFAGGSEARGAGALGAAEGSDARGAAGLRVTDRLAPESPPSDLGAGAGASLVPDPEPGGGPSHGTRDVTPGIGIGGRPSGPRGPGRGERVTDCSPGSPEPVGAAGILPSDWVGVKGREARSCDGASAAGSAGASGASGVAGDWLTAASGRRRESRAEGRPPRDDPDGVSDPSAPSSPDVRAGRRAPAGPGAWPPGSPGASSSEVSGAELPVSAVGGSPAAPPACSPSGGRRVSRWTPVPASRASLSCGIGPLPDPSTIAAPRPYSVAPRCLRYSRCFSFHSSSV